MLYLYNACVVVHTLSRCRMLLFQLSYLLFRYPLCDCRHYVVCRCHIVHWRICLVLSVPRRLMFARNVPCLQSVHMYHGVPVQTQNYYMVRLSSSSLCTSNANNTAMHDSKDCPVGRQQDRCDSFVRGAKNIIRNKSLKKYCLRQKYICGGFLDACAVPTTNPSPARKNRVKTIGDQKETATFETPIYDT